MLMDIGTFRSDFAFFLNKVFMKCLKSRGPLDLNFFSIRLQEPTFKFLSSLEASSAARVVFQTKSCLFVDHKIYIKYKSNR